MATASTEYVFVGGSTVARVVLVAVVVVNDDDGDDSDSDIVVVDGDAIDDMLLLRIFRLLFKPVFELLVGASNEVPLILVQRFFLPFPLLLPLPPLDDFVTLKPEAICCWL